MTTYLDQQKHRIHLLKQEVKAKDREVKEQ